MMGRVVFVMIACKVCHQLLLLLLLRFVVMYVVVVYLFKRYEMRHVHIQGVVMMIVRNNSHMFQQVVKPLRRGTEIKSRPIFTIFDRMDEAVQEDREHTH